MRTLLLAAVSLLAAAPFASATQLTYAPINPSFQPGNQLAGSHLLSIAEAQKKKTDTSSGLFDQRVSDLVKNSVVSRLSTSIYDSINDNNSGFADFGDGSSVTWGVSGSNKIITFTDLTGSTSISIPL